MDIAELVLDYIEVFIWPSVVITAIVIVVWRFHQQIGRLIDRIRRFGWMGADVAAGPLEQPMEELAEERIASEESHRAELEDLQRRAGDAVGKWQDAYNQLWPRLTTAELHLSYEMNYRVIYGTQISLLESLREKGSAGASLFEVFLSFQQHITAVLAVAPGAKPDYGAYLGFLSTAGLVGPRAGLGGYAITDYGKGFLDYLETSNIPRRKPY